MNIFLEASRIKLRVKTTSGVLSVEQLWDLTLFKLASAIKEAKKTLQKDSDDELSFLDEAATVNKEDQLTFDILKEIYLTKKSEIEAEKEKANIKANNDKIMALIYQKQESALGEKSIDELKALLM